MIWYEFDSFRFDAETRTLMNRERPVALAPKSGDLLLLFLENPQKLFSKQELVKKLWNEFVGDGSLLYQVHKVRDALGRRPNGEEYIETLSKRGYQFVAPVQKRDSAASESPALSDLDQPPISAERGNGRDDAGAVGQTRQSVRRLVGFAIAGGIILGAIGSTLTPPRLSVARYVKLTSDTRVKAGGPLLTDGVRDYFEERGLTGPTLASVAVAGSGTGIVGLPPGDVQAFDLSPLTSELLTGRFATGQDVAELWVIPLLGGAPRRIGDLRATSAYWSPDRQHIAFTVHKELYVSKFDGSERRRIVTVPGDAIFPRWSHDGKKLCFTELNRYQSETFESIWEVGVDGSNPNRLLQGWNSPPHEYCGGWTPDSKFLIFQSTRDGRNDLWGLPEQIGLLRRGSRSPVRLSSGLLGFSSPVISADGKQLFAIGTEKRGELVRFDFKLREFVQFLNGINATWVSFSRSGHSFAYVDLSDQTIWRANLDGSGKTQITFPPLEADGLSWSPDGKWLAMRARIPGDPLEDLSSSIRWR